MATLGRWGGVTASRTVLVAVGVLVVVGVAALGVRAWLAEEAPEPWEDQAVAELALSPDQRTIWVRAEDYLSPSCWETEAAVDRGPEEWVVTLEARKDSADGFCTAEGCIVPDAPPPGPARTLSPDERELGCSTTRIDLDAPVPDDVVVLPA